MRRGGLVAVALGWFEIHSSTRILGNADNVFLFLLAWRGNRVLVRPRGRGVTDRLRLLTDCPPRTCPRPAGLCWGCCYPRGVLQDPLEDPSQRPFRASSSSNAPQSSFWVFGVTLCCPITPGGPAGSLQVCSGSMIPNFGSPTGYRIQR